MPHEVKWMRELAQRFLDRMAWSSDEDATAAERDALVSINGLLRGSDAPL